MLQPLSQLSSFFVRFYYSFSFVIAWQVYSFDPANPAVCEHRERFMLTDRVIDSAANPAAATTRDRCDLFFQSGWPYQRDDAFGFLEYLKGGRGERGGRGKKQKIYKSERQALF